LVLLTLEDGHAEALKLFIALTSKSY
jgi:hypothetical protein